MKQVTRVYSWEIRQLLDLKQELLEYQEYLKVISTSPQIDYIEYLPNEDKLHITTDDRYDFKFKVKRINEGNNK